MRVEKWREDAQLEKFEDATAAEELPEDEGDGDSTETDSIEDRWARIGVFPTVTNKPPRGPAPRADRTVSLRMDSARTTAPPKERPSATPDEDAAPSSALRGEQVPAPKDADRSAPLRDRRTPAPHDADRTTSLLRKEPADTPRDTATASPDEDASSPRDASDAATPRGERASDPRKANRVAPSRGEQVDGPSASRDDRAGRAAPARDGDDGPTAPRGDRADAGRETAPRDADRTAALLRKEAADAPRGERASGVRDTGPAAESPDGEQTTVLRSPRAGAGAKRPWPASSAGAAAGAAVRDPWQEEEPSGEAVAVTHDPHEVTVQLDAVQFADGVLRRAPARPNAGQEGSDGPVFVDESGRRSRRYRRIGMTIGLVCAGYAVVIVATLLSGKSDAPWLPVPGQQQEQQPAGKVETTPKPGETDATPGAGTSLLPGGSPSPGAPTLPEPGASIAAPGTTADPDEPGATADPKPSQTRKTQKPGTGSDDDPASEAPAETPTTAPADPPPPADDPAPETTAPTDGSAGGTDVTGVDTNAAAPAARPVADESPDAEPEPSAPPAAPSPEYVL
ncbi:hypothetical protein GCM10010297_32070 [Streptomyces malachitofuscus]|nr:hypothetical protein GCM10010297_32070 [Streptomyces malachitofuscus]